MNSVHISNEFHGWACNTQNEIQATLPPALTASRLHGSWSPLPSQTSFLIVYRSPPTHTHFTVYLHWLFFWNIPGRSLWIADAAIPSSCHSVKPSILCTSNWAGPARGAGEPLMTGRSWSKAFGPSLSGGLTQVYAHSGAAHVTYPCSGCFSCPLIFSFLLP